MWLKFKEIEEHIVFIQSEHLDYRLREKGYNSYESNTFVSHDYTIEHRETNYLIRMHYSTKKRVADSGRIKKEVRIRFDIVTRSTIEIKTVSKKFFVWMYLKNDERWIHIVEQIIKDIEEIHKSFIESSSVVEDTAAESS